MPIALAVLRLLLEAGPPPLNPADLQAVYGLLGILLVARLVCTPLIYFDARRKSGRETWWATAVLFSPLIAGIIYLIVRAPKDRAGPSSWNPWVPCPHCGAPRGWSPDPCPRCGGVITLAPPPPPALPPAPGYPVPPAGYGPSPAYAPPVPAPPKRSTDVTVPQIVGALLFVLVLTNVAALLALLPSLLSGVTENELMRMQESPLFVLLALILQDSILLAVSLDQSLFQGRLTRQKLGLAWRSTGHGLQWHIGIGVAAGLTAFAFSALSLNFIMQILQSAGTDLPSSAAGEPSVFSLNDYLMLIPSYVIIAPVSEEIFFRGYALGGLSQRGYVNIGVVFTSILFGAIHLNPLAFFSLVMAGVMLAGVYLRTGSLVAPIIAHATNNFLALTLAYYGV